MNTLPYSLKKHTERKSIIIGVIGGAGPDAAINFQIKLSNAMKRILKAKTDAEHYRVLVDNNTQVNEQHSCSMEEKLLHQGYLQSAFLLKKMGANIITIPCNSAHAYYEEIKEEAFPALLVNMIDETCHFLVNSLLNYRNSIGLLAVPETINKNIYHAPLKKHEFYPIVPGSEIQKKILQAIVAIKSGIYNEKFYIKRYPNNKFEEISDVIIVENLKNENALQRLKSPLELLTEAIKHLRKRGANCILLGCSEISIIVDKIEDKENILIVDPIDILAKRTIELAQSMEEERNFVRLQGKG